MGVDIHDAAKRGNTSAIAEYIRAGGNLYWQDRQGNPPLHVASLYGKEASVAALLGAGVDPAALNAKGETPLALAERNGHYGCASVLRGDSPPTPRSAASAPYDEQPASTDETLSTNKKKKEKEKGKGKEERKEKGKPSRNGKDTAVKETGRTSEKKQCGEALPPPPPKIDALPTSLGTDGFASSFGNAKLHLCRDQHGNAYFYDETSGESVWASDDRAATDHWRISPVADGGDANGSKVPSGWSLHNDPTTGHPYYLNVQSHESVWAESDGSFPLQTNSIGNNCEPESLQKWEASSSKHHGFPASGEACIDWGDENGEGDIGFFRLEPSAPPLTATMLKAMSEHLGTFHEIPPNHPSGGYVESGDRGKDMLLCTSGVMSTNRFFAARESLVGGGDTGSLPSGEEGSARTPPGGAGLSPLPATGSGGNRSRLLPFESSHQGYDVSSSESSRSEKPTENGSDRSSHSERSASLAEKQPFEPKTKTAEGDKASRGWYDREARNECRDGTIVAGAEVAVVIGRNVKTSHLRFGKDAVKGVVSGDSGCKRPSIGQDVLTKDISGDPDVEPSKLPPPLSVKKGGGKGLGSLSRSVAKCEIDSAASEGVPAPRSSEVRDDDAGL